MEYYSVVKKEEEEEKFTLCNSIDGPGEHYAKWNKQVRERQIPCDFTHMWNLMNKQNKQGKWGQTQMESRMTASEEGRRIEQKGKGSHRHRKQYDDC